MLTKSKLGELRSILVERHFHSEATRSPANQSNQGPPSFV
jgi:hypothetical protein